MKKLNILLQIHHDTEKAEGMFGTLVIQLPSYYSGGKLVVYHRGNKMEFDYSGIECSGSCYFTSFYADCRHEVEKVTKGYRLCLIYNLIYQGLGECPTPANNQKKVSAIVSAMKAWGEDISSGKCPPMMTYLLEHEYCGTRLSFNLLKNGDRAVTDVLVQAKARVDFDLYMGIVNLKEVWTAEYSGYEEVNPGEFIGEDICAMNLRASDTNHNLSCICLSRSSFVPEDFFDDIDPDEEATDNGDATVNKQYNWAALLLWPKGLRGDIIGVENMISLFEQNVTVGNGGLVDTANDIIKEIRYKGVSCSSSLSFLSALNVITDTKLIAELLNVIANNGACHRYMENTTFYSSILSIAYTHGWDILESPLQTMFASCSSRDVEKYCTFLEKMIASKKLGCRKKLCQNLLGIIVKFLADEEDATPPRSLPTLYSSCCYKGCLPPPEVCRNKEFVSQLFSLLTTVGSKDLFTCTISTMQSKPVRYPILETLGPAIVDLYKSAKIKKDNPVQEILTYCISQLETSLHKVLMAPTDNSKPVRFMCSCKDCMELKCFLIHPTETQHQFRVNKSRRQHLHDQLDSTRADVIHKTELTGSPHTLVVTKTNASYEENAKKQRQEQALLASLKHLLYFGNMQSEKAMPPAKRKKDSTNSSVAVDLT